MTNSEYRDGSHLTYGDWAKGVREDNHGNLRGPNGEEIKDSRGVPLRVDNGVVKPGDDPR